MEKSKRMVLYTMYAFFIFSNLIAVVEDVGNFTLIRYIFMICIILYTMNNNLNPVRKYTRYEMFILMLMLMQFSILPLVNYFYIFSDFQIVLNCVINLIFIMFLQCISKTILSLNKLETFLDITIVTIFIFVIFMFFKYSDKTISLTKIIHNFRETRETFGFSHPNSLGAVCFVYLIVSFYKLILSGIKKAILFSQLVILYILLCSASRTPLISFCTFIFLYFLFIFMKYGIKYRYLIYMEVFFGLILVVVNLIFNMKNTDIYFKLLNNLSSFRLQNWINLIDFMKKSQYNFLGIAFVNVSYLYSYFKCQYSSDNWFMYSYLTRGVIGVILSLIFLISIFVKLIYKKGCESYSKRIFIITSYIVLIEYSMFENVFFNAGTLLSAVWWILIFYMIHLNESSDKLVNRM